MVHSEARLLRGLYVQTKVKLNSLCDRVIDLVDMFLMDVYQVPWSGAQRLAKRAARCLGDFVQLLNDFPRLSAYKLMGKEWKVIFVGQSDELLEACSLLFTDSDVTQEELDRVALWKLPAQTERWLAGEVDLVVCELSNMYPRASKSPIAFSVPTRVTMVLDISEGPEVLLSGRKRRGIRRSINKGKELSYGSVYSRSRSDFEYFYERMYLPFIQQRHGALANLSTAEDQWRKWSRRGGVLFVTQDNRRVAGSLCHLADGTCYGIELGILDADPDLFRQGLITLVVWNTIKWGYDRGATLFDMEGTHAHCSYGSFRSKQVWGARVARRKRIYNIRTFAARHLPQSLIDHLNSLGLISEMDGKFLAVLLDSEQAPLTKDELEARLIEAAEQGLDGLVLISGDSAPAVHCIPACPVHHRDRTLSER